jgi:PAS domain S-box-containing protein
MGIKMESTLATNLNPVLSITKDCAVLYTNEAGKLLLHEWGVKVGEKLPLNIGDLVQRVISRNSPEKLEVKVGSRFYLFVFSPFPEVERVNISGFDISDQNKLDIETQGNLKRSHELLNLMEEALRKSHNYLEEKVKERTAELENTVLFLKESQGSLSEAQAMAHIGNWSQDIVTGGVHWSDEAYRIFGFKPQETGVTYDAFLSHVHPDDRDYVVNKIRQALNGNLFDIEYRIILTDGIERIIHETFKVIFDKNSNPIQLKGIVQDVTDRKRAEEAFNNIEIARKKEIHHRIKNNLQVISSLLDLQAEKFRNKSNINYSEVVEAFRESQDRVISMALIHEELYKGKDTDTINFSSYIEELTDNLFLTYKLENIDVSLSIDMEENLFFDMDTAVPLGMIVNELVSNSFKHAFSGRNKGEIQIKLQREEKIEYLKCITRNSKNTTFVLTVSDNGVGIPNNLNFEKLDSLGLQLVTTLVDQLDGELNLNRENWTVFIIRFMVKENNNPEMISTPQLI